MSIFHLQRYGDVVRAPADTGMGATWRPFRMAESQDARIAGLETLYDFWINAITDPDQALMRDRNFRERLTMHPDVAACMNVREQSVLGMEDKCIAPQTAVDKQSARLVAEYANSVWQRIPHRDLMYQQMQQAILWGGVGHEWMWLKEATGTQRPVKAFPVDKSRFIWDRRGNMALLTRLTPVWGSYIKQIAKPATGDDLLIDQLIPGKFTYHIYEQSWGTWERPDLEGYLYYGQGEDVNLYEVVTRDFAIWVQEMLWLEQYGRPPRFLYVPPSDWDAWATRIATDLLTKQVVVLPFRPGGPTGAQKMFEVDQPDVPKTGYDAFGASRQRNTANIEKIMLMNAGVMSDAESAGGYSAHVSQVESGPTVMAKRDGRRISSTITHDLLPWIIKFGPPQFANCPPSDLPILSLKATRDDEPAEITDLFMKASQVAPVSLAEFYERTNLRQPTAPDDVIFTGQMMDELQGLLEAGAGQIPSNAIGPRVGGNGENGQPDMRPRAAVGSRGIKQPVGNNKDLDEEREEREP